MDHLSQARWKTASYCNGGNGCVEVAGNLDGAAAVRDSTRPDDGAIVFDRATFTRFLDDVKEGSFDL